MMVEDMMTGKLSPTAMAVATVGGAVTTPPGGGDPDAAAAHKSRRKMGGSYSTYTGSNGNGLSAGLTLNNDGELVDSSGRPIKTDAYTTSVSNMEAVQGGLNDQSRQ